jgi:hypothetical protein
MCITLYKMIANAVLAQNSETHVLACVATDMRNTYILTSDNEADFRNEIQKMADTAFTLMVVASKDGTRLLSYAHLELLHQYSKNMPVVYVKSSGEICGNESFEKIWERVSQKSSPDERRYQFQVDEVRSFSPINVSE